MTTKQPHVVENETVDQGPARALIYLRVSTKEQAGTGGEAEGYSIPAQRAACKRKAEALHAAVIGEYVDAGESARSADRPALQEMLERLQRDQDAKYVIVHKIDRLARNRADDVMINLALQKAAATLVSCSENIDETPSGKLLHGIMATIAEFYSQNLAMEAKKGMRQKAIAGGTPNRAPIGYLNIRTTIEGREVRTIGVDEERASTIQWAFEAFSTGEWTTRTLHAELEARGLTSRGDYRGPPKPLARAQVHSMLRNPYYVGIVVYDGIHYPGSHEAIIELETFQRVQGILSDRSEGKERPIKRTHYLKGTLACGHCGANLGLTHSRGHGGMTYPYFYCLGRQQKKDCQLPYLPVQEIEESVLRYWSTVTIRDSELDQLQALVLEHIHLASLLNGKEVARQEDRLQRLDGEARKLLQAHYAEAVSLPRLHDEQQRIEREEAQARKVLAACSLQFDQVRENLGVALARLRDCGRSYADGNERIRRDMNRAIFEKLYIVEDGVGAADLARPYGVLLSEDLPERLEREVTALREGKFAELLVPEATPNELPTPAQIGRRSRRTRSYERPEVEPLPGWILTIEPSRRERPAGWMPWEIKNADLLRDRCSNEPVLVGAAGFEPAASAV